MKGGLRLVGLLTSALISNQKVAAFVLNGYRGLHIRSNLNLSEQRRRRKRTRWNPLNIDPRCLQHDETSAIRSGQQTLHKMVLEGDRDDEKVSTDSTTKEYLREILTSPIIEAQLGVLVLLTSVLAAFSTLEGLPVFVYEFIIGIENVICAIFALEYFARWYLNGFSWKHLTKPLVLVDLIAITPLVIQFMPSLGFIIPPNIASDGLVSLRLLRILRLQRVLEDYDSFCRFTKALGMEECNIKPYQLQLARVVLSVFTLLSISSALIYSAEHTVNPQIPDFLSALYFGLTTLTTVGFGDIYPVTSEGRFIVASSILVGVTVIPYQSASLAEALLESSKQERETVQEETTNNNVSVNGPVLDKKVKKKSGKSILGEECDVCDTDEPGLFIQNGRLKLRTTNSTTKEVTDNNRNAGITFVAPNQQLNGPLTTSSISVRQQQQQLQQTSPLYRICSICGSAPHRADAGFCWGCGSPLPPLPPSAFMMDRSGGNTQSSSNNNNNIDKSEVVEVSHSNALPIANGTQQSSDCCVVKKS